MKLKKIAALALAGVMAVSALAGCSTAGEGDNGGASSEEPTTPSGYSVTMAENLPDVEEKDNAIFQDNDKDAAALQKALNYVAADTVDKIVSNGGAKVAVHVGKYNNAYSDVAKMVSNLKANLDVTDSKFDTSIGLGWYADGNNGSKLLNSNVKEATLFVADGSVGVDEAIEQVASQLENSLVNGLPETSKNHSEVFNYDYTISVSVAEREGTDTSSLNFILVTVSRTVTADVKG